MSNFIPAAFASTAENKACAGIRQDFANCLLRTDCVLKQGLTPQECLQKHGDELPEECQFLRKSLATCKRGMVSGSSSARPPALLQRTDSLSAHPAPASQLDMRKRFRGNPSTTNNHKETVPAVSIIGVNAHEDRSARPAPPPPTADGRSA